MLFRSGGQFSYKTLISGGVRSSDSWSSGTLLIICLQLLSEDGKTGLRGFTRIYDDCTSTVILFNPKTKQFINYEDSVSVQAKTVRIAFWPSQKRTHITLGMGQERRSRRSHGLR